MKVRTTRARTALGARLTALGWGALILLAPVAVSACSSTSSPTTPTIPSISTSVTTSSTGTGPATAPASDGGTTSSGTPGVPSSTPPPPTATATVTVTATSSTSQTPNAAPATGGGGTAGLQDGLLFAVGAAAILVGAGSIVYRRRLTRDR